VLIEDAGTVHSKLSVALHGSFCGCRNRAEAEKKSCDDADHLALPLAEKRKMVVERKVSPGLSSVEGKSGRLGASG
jgi:hypothetical protein